MQAHIWTNCILRVTRRHLKSVGGYLLASKEFFEVGKSHLNENMTGREKALKKKNLLIGWLGLWYCALTATLLGVSYLS